MSITYGYVRVSSKDQNEDRQLISMREFGVNEEHIYIDKLSGKDFNRPHYQLLLSKLRPGDVMVVKSIDRLGRNYAEILEQWRLITKHLRADMVVIDMALLDTRSKEKDLTGTLIADIVLQLLSYVAQTERESIKQRQAEGIAAARSRGVRFGRPPKPIPAEFEKIRAQYRAGKLSSRKAARLLSVSQDTFLRWIEKFEGSKV